MNFAYYTIKHLLAMLMMTYILKGLALGSGMFLKIKCTLHLTYILFLILL